MSFSIFVDGSSNLPGEILRKLDISILPCSYSMNGVPSTYDGCLDTFDSHEYYEMLRQGGKVQTSLLNTQLFLDAFRPVLERGEDVVYFSMSSGISGTYQAAKIAAEELMETYPERTVRVVDSLGSGFGTGLMACKASDLRAAGKDARETADIMDEDAQHTLQFFTVDDLNYLKAGGRVSNAAALVGGMLAIKPVLYVPDAGTLDVAKKVRGRKTAVNSILDSAKADLAEVDTNGQKIHILQADCRADAEYVRDELKKAYPDLGEITITSLGVVIGAHCGPGLLTVFYLCNGRRP